MSWFKKIKYVKIGETEKKNTNPYGYITANKFNRFLGEIFFERLKQAKLAKSLDVNVEQHVIKNEKKITDYKHVTYFTFHLSYFLSKFF